MPKAIHWFRRDLRIADNTALHPASKNGTVIPVYLLSDWKGSHHWTGSNRQQFLCDCLESLAKNLGTLGGRLIIREGDAVSALEMLIRETAAETIYYNRDPDPFDKRTETRLHELCSKLSISCHGYDDVALHNPYEVLTQPGGRAVQKRMDHAVSKIVRSYSSLRDIPSEDGTSRLSQDLRYGLISIRTLYTKVEAEHKTASGSARLAIGIYIKRWIPELAGVDPKGFQAPPEDNRSLADGYPLPCLDHKTERNRTLAIFKKHRKNRISSSSQFVTWRLCVRHPPSRHALRHLQRDFPRPRLPRHLCRGRPTRLHRP